MPNILTAVEVAALLCISKDLLYKHYKRFGGIRIGRNIRFEKSVVETIIKEEMYVNHKTQEGLASGVNAQSCAAQESRVHYTSKSTRGRISNETAVKDDKFGLYKVIREQIIRTTSKKG